jgi:protocatechuate 3,4-dioxygenase beta subunit
MHRFPASCEFWLLLLVACGQEQRGDAASPRHAEDREHAWTPPPASAAWAESRQRGAAESRAEPLYRTALAEAAGDADAALDAIEAALVAGACATRALTESVFQTLRTNERFRRLIGEHARQWDTVLVTADEPGTPLVVGGVVRDPAGKPVPDAHVYVFHTDATGTYSQGSLDEANPRLFGFLRSDPEGRYRFRTIRPAPYPDEREPVEQHIHFVVTTPDGAAHACRMGFADDPHWLGRSVPRWAAAVTKDAAGRELCSFDLTWR